MHPHAQSTQGTFVCDNSSTVLKGILLVKLFLISLLCTALFAVRMGKFLKFRKEVLALA